MTRRILGGANPDLNAGVASTSSVARPEQSPGAFGERAHEARRGLEATHVRHSAIREIIGELAIGSNSAACQQWGQRWMRGW